MMKLRRIHVLAATVVALTAATWVYAQQSQSPSRPPSISEESWIPITDSVGIVVRAVRPDWTGDMLYGTGAIMSLHQGKWLVFEELTVTNNRPRSLNSNYE